MDVSSIVGVLERTIHGEITPAETKQFVDLLCHSQVVPPLAKETAAVALVRPKTAALCYDRVWDFEGGTVPEGIRFTGHAEAFREYVSWIAGLGHVLHGHPLQELLDMGFESGDHLNVYHPRLGWIDAVTKRLAAKWHAQSDSFVLPLFESVAGRNELDTPGQEAVVYATLAGLQIVNEDTLDWQQVADFRSDAVARSKYRRLLHWLSADMAGKEKSFIEDEIAARLEDYEWALRKHGVGTLLGVVSEALDGRFLAGGAAVGASVALAGSPGLALLASGVLVVGRVAVSLGKKLVDLENVKRGPNSEISFVYEVKRLFMRP